MPLRKTVPELSTWRHSENFSDLVDFKENENMLVLADPLHQAACALKKGAGNGLSILLQVLEAEFSLRSEILKVFTVVLAQILKMYEIGRKVISKAQKASFEFQPNTASETVN